MKRSLLYLLVVVASLGGLSAQGKTEIDSLPVLMPKSEHPNSLFVIIRLINQYHYRKLPIDDSLSTVIYDNYVSSLDPNKLYFLKADIDYFERYRKQLDDDLQNANLDFGYQLFGLYRERALERINQLGEILSTEFDFTKDEFYETDFDQMDWAKSRDELTNRWRKILKNEAITYKMAGREWDDIKESLTNRYKRIRKSIYQYNSEDVFQYYMNALTSAFDPHTDYFSPITSENFQINMSLSLEGIGARLTQRLDYTTVAEVVPGGPAFKSKGLEKNDRIIGVAQGDEGEFVDVIGWRLDDVIQLIRGPKGSVVRLQLLKSAKDVQALPDTLRLVREKIKLEDESAKAEMIPITENTKTYKLGVVSIPNFYVNFEERNRGVKDYKSTTRDVKALIKDLKSQGIDGLLIDLRYNGGGSLQEAIDLTGLFVPSGPAVQVKNSDFSVDILSDDDNNQVFYDGPLAVLTNRYSASASEIFSGAVQDYRRGIILGENSFGKGTVQNLIDLDRPVVAYLNQMARVKKASNQDVGDILRMRNGIQSGNLRLGQLKMTLAKFYRVTGSSTQRMGVRPDIQFPTPFDHTTFGESSRPNALPWDEISSSNFGPTNEISSELIKHLKSLYARHLETDPGLQKLIADIEKIKEDRANTKISLNLAERQSANEEEADDMSTTVPQGEVFTDEANQEKLKEDPYLKESLRILAEMSSEKNR
ncbi:MAG: carboxy terminal-processing peptidase [Cyclobacteriaceae bacterium]|nr:carboxy terminal-processing peptidase [Cyclobacteriaceae bacterium HetDA_MAG_MS6]